MSLFTIASLLAWVLLVGLAYLRRGRVGATFIGVLLGVHTLSSTSMYAHSPTWLTLVWPYFQATVFIHFFFWFQPKLRNGWYRAFVSIPGSWFVAATFLAFPWAIVGALGVPLYAAWLPYALGLIGLVQSLRTRSKDVHLTLDDIEYPTLGPIQNTDIRSERPLKVVQITDPHLGPFMSVERLRKICQNAVDAKPDIILLTGDYLTVESQYDSSYLTRALEPLKAMPGKVFACRGNHDLEVPHIVDEALAKNNIRLLNDAAAMIQTEAGLVQIVGSDFHWGNRAAKLAELCRQFPRVPEALRLILLHDPGAFTHLPDGEADLVFSGHTHGGQLGFVSLGHPMTFVRAVTPIPDHGFWAKGTNRLYIHRGTGFYGFPLRLGVPAEEGALFIHYDRK
jgi:predicted MPP superfamily phosphohydrolase